MQNLDQIRAAAALKTAEARNHQNPKFVRSDVAGFPALILTNGLLAAVAYATEGSESRRGIQFVCDELATYLSMPVHGIKALKNAKDGKSLIESLTRPHDGVTPTTLDLQRATSEALEFLGYVKRFAPRD